MNAAIYENATFCFLTEKIMFVPTFTRSSIYIEILKLQRSWLAAGNKAIANIGKERFLDKQYELYLIGYQ